MVSAAPGPNLAEQSIPVESPVKVFDVAAYILQQKGPMTTWKLQKLVYYCQAWSLVWDDHVLFDEEIQAWINGPVVPALYQAHRGEYRLARVELGNPDALNENQRETVDVVLGFYGDKSSQWLSDLTHREDPWRKARIGVPDGERGTARITEESLAEYYSSLQAIESGNSDALTNSQQEAEALFSIFDGEQGNVRITEESPTEYYSKLLRSIELSNLHVLDNQARVVVLDSHSDNSFFGWSNRLSSLGK